MLKWIILAPLIGAAINGFFGKRLNERIIGLIACGSVAVSAILSFVSFSQLYKLPAEHRIIQDYFFTWLDVGGFRADFAYLLDPLSGVYILFITGVGLLIHIYAVGYMHGDPGFYRFFAYLNLFMFMMLTLVLGDNLLVLFVGWEGVGLCSYLLIGYYIRREEAGNAAKKAFIVNRIGDFGFMIGTFLVFTTFGTISFVEKAGVSSFLEQANKLPIGAAVLTAIAILLFVGATGKSAQIPLFVWLPDAMAGPTPVSALIHAATMVTAGVYLTARCSAVVVKSPTAMLIMAIVGAATAIFAATIGLAQNDIKKVLAYSTVSQLGFMFLACGVGAFTAGIFHVMTHAFFKALLFLGSGSVIHGMHEEQDIRKMGGLRKYMPITWVTMMVGWLAISGFPMMSGFFSKDEIIWKTFSTTALPPGYGKILWAIASFTALLTAIYMTRMMVMTFFGKERFGNNHAHAPEHDHDHEKQHHGHQVQPHESSALMWVPLVILAILSIVGGWIGWPKGLGGANHFEHFLEPVIAPVAAAVESHDYSLEHMITYIATAIGLIGIGIGLFIFLRKPLMKMPKILENKWYVDEVYNSLIIAPFVQSSRDILWKIIDVKIIDGFVNALARSFGVLSQGLRITQSGNTRSYAAIILTGAVVIIGIFGYIGLK